MDGLWIAILVQIVVRAAFGVACMLIAQNRGRSAVGWFFIGAITACIGLIILLVIPDLKAQQERERRLADENRRLREKLKKDRMVADERHAELSRRVVAHDVALGVDTSAPATQALPGVAPAASPAPSRAAGQAPPEAVALRSSTWFWANGLNREGPIAFMALQQLWQEARVTADTLVWTKGMPKWIAVRDVPGLEDTLDA